MTLPFTSYYCRDDFADSYITQSEKALAPIFGPLTKSIFSRISSPLRGGTVVDLGGGTGQWLEELLNHELSVGILIDLDEEMTRHAWQARGRYFCNKLSSGHPKSFFHVIRGRAEAIPLRSSICDLIVSRNSMHLWTDLPKAWQEISRILRVGGWVFIGRGFGPDLPETIRDQVRNARRALKDPSDSKSEEPPSPSTEIVSKIAADCGIATVEIIPDHKSWWLLGQKQN